VAWAAKIGTDPFQNVAIYWDLPLVALVRGEPYNPL